MSSLLEALTDSVAGSIGAAVGEAVMDDRDTALWPQLEDVKTRDATPV